VSAEENKALVRRAVDSVNSGQPLDDILSLEHTIHGAEGSTQPGGPLPYSINVEAQTVVQEV
jgi:hypothetical protein